jgi:hypothetical protein
MSGTFQRASTAAIDDFGFEAAVFRFGLDPTDIGLKSMANTAMQASPCQFAIYVRGAWRRPPLHNPAHPNSDAK